MSDRQPLVVPKYLLTGVSGLLGLNLAKHLTAKGLPISGLSWRKEVRLERLEYCSCDLRNADRLRSLILGIRPDIVIHCAAATDVDWCETNPEAAWSINALPCAAVASAVNEIGGIFVLISTDSVFDGATGNYEENDVPRPLNAYAKSKLAAEQLVSRNAERWIIIRTNIYGWNGQQKNSLSEWILQELSAGRTITGFDDAVFAPLLAWDLGPLIEKMVARKVRGIYHAGASHSISKYDFARQLAAIYGLNERAISRGKLADAKFLAPRPLNTSLSSAKLQKELDLALPSIEDGLKRFHEQGMNGWARNLKELIL